MRQLTIFDAMAEQARPMVDCKQCKHFQGVGATAYRCAIGEFGCLCSLKGIYGLYLGCRQFEEVSNGPKT
jgi:hypothetical protein